MITGAYVLTAHASDPDGGAFSFSLSTSTVPFRIDSSTGDVNVTDSNRVDREVRMRTLILGAYVPSYDMLH